MKKYLYKSYNGQSLKSAKPEEIGGNTNFGSKSICENCPYFACMQVAFKPFSITGYCTRMRCIVDGASPCLQHPQSLQLSIF